MMAGQQHTTTHYFISFRISTCSSFMIYIFKARLAENIACKYSTRLDITLFKEYLEITADERCAFTDRYCKCEPSGTGIGQLLRQDKELFPLCEELTHPVIVAGPAIDIGSQIIQLYQSESSAQFSRLNIKARLFEYEFCIVRNAIYFNVEAVFNSFAFYK